MSENAITLIMAASVWIPCLFVIGHMLTAENK
jgi:hypothetical protein